LRRAAGPFAVGSTGRYCLAAGGSAAALAGAIAIAPHSKAATGRPHL